MKALIDLGWIDGMVNKTDDLLGIAEVRDSIEESVVYACLGATNRWTSDS